MNLATPKGSKFLHHPMLVCLCCCFVGCFLHLPPSPTCWKNKSSTYFSRPLSMTTYVRLTPGTAYLIIIMVASYVDFYAFSLPKDLISHLFLCFIVVSHGSPTILLMLPGKGSSLVHFQTSKSNKCLASKRHFLRVH